ncbi:unnamed protein product [Macrosiphum euphorbiae]|uniref:Uncharacterized protein n=1 Tax=Macrosiphum euphorbiae TaxID=13131 RepID=A0AAV0WAP7_9HEMI|nr:unnamed protein product [Macrosiphum euphorbiae]
MAADDELERNKLSKGRALAKRESYVTRIKAIHTTALSASDDATKAPRLLAASAKLDNLLTGFEIEDNAVFEAYCNLDMLGEYTTDLLVEVNEWVYDIQSIVFNPSPGVTLTWHNHAFSVDYLKFRYRNSMAIFISGPHSAISSLR